MACVVSLSYQLGYSDTEAEAPPEESKEDTSSLLASTVTPHYNTSMTTEDVEAAAEREEQGASSPMLPGSFLGGGKLQYNSKRTT